jgi:leucyl/phenylalanyl-tRNA--protein transferase
MAVNANSEEINFYQPLKRFIIPINTFHIPKKLLNDYKKKKYVFKINNNFISVIESCSDINKQRDETWINRIIKDSYINLFNKGYAKSIECYEDDKLQGGLYGVHIGSCFFGESMFSKKNNTSKFCLLYLISLLKEFNFNLLDSQFYNSHLVQFGAYEISNREYQTRLKKNITLKSIFPNEYKFQNSISVLQSISHKS